MKDKTAAARLLLDAGWTFEEVAAALGEESSLRPPTIPTLPIRPEPIPWAPYAPNYLWFVEPSTTIDSSGVHTVNGVPVLTS